MLSYLSLPNLHGIILWLYRYRWHALFLVLSTVLVAFGFQEGFEHAQVNQFRDQSVQLPILYSYADNTLFPGDLLLQARETYVTWLYPILGILSRIVPLYALMLALYICSVALTVSAVYALSEDLFPGAQVGIIAVILWTAWLPNPGGDFLRSSFPTHTTTAVGLQLWGLVFALRRRYELAALLIGLAININAMTGVFITSVWVFDLLHHRQVWSQRLIRIPLIMGLAALPTLWWKFAAAPAEQTIPMEHFVEIMRTRLWYAIFPFSVNMQLWLLFVAVLGLWVYSARYALPETNRRVLWMMQGIVALFIIGTVFTEFIPLGIVMELQLLRSTWVLNLFAMLYFANMIRAWLRGNRRQVYLALGLTFVLAAPRMVLELIPIPQPVPYESYMDFDPMRDQSRVTVLGAFGLIVLVLTHIYVVRHMLPQASIKDGRRLSGWFVFAIGLFLAPLFINTHVPQKQITTTQAWEETLHWIRDNTPKDASFITPPTMDGFRIEAERAQFSDWKDGTLLIFNAELAEEWLRRMEALGFDEDTFSFAPLTTQQLCKIAHEYQMDYTVVFREWAIEGEVVYQNAVFAVMPTEKLACSSQTPRL